jgi:NTP pyrophosphatase (non-canonical NTP hydrolase)
MPLNDGFNFLERPAAGIEKLACRILNINIANGWDVTNAFDWPEGQKPKEEAANKLAAKLALIHSEVSEALEALRAGNRENYAEELADVVIRVLDHAAGLNIDIGQEIELKLERNASRGYRHGGKAL